MVGTCAAGPSVAAGVGAVEAAAAAQLQRQAEARLQRRAGSAQARRAQLAVQLLQLAQEAVVGVDVAPRAHQRQRLRQRHAALDHQERQRARCRPRHAHEAVHQHATWNQQPNTLSHQIHVVL